MKLTIRQVYNYYLVFSLEPFASLEDIKLARQRILDICSTREFVDYFHRLVKVADDLISWYEAGQQIDPREEKDRVDLYLCPVCYSYRFWRGFCYRCEYDIDDDHNFSKFKQYFRCDDG